MIMVQARCGVCEIQEEAPHDLMFFVRQGKRLGLLQEEFGDYYGKNDLLEGLRSELTDCGGQYLSLDLSCLEKNDFTESLLMELESAHSVYRRRFNLSLILPSPFIHRAILWQRLCDRLIEDEEPQRATLFVIENFDLADERTQCDVERLIRFHITHNIRRTFLLTLQDEESLRSSLRRLVEIRL